MRVYEAKETAYLNKTNGNRTIVQHLLDCVFTLCNKLAVSASDYTVAVKGFARDITATENELKTHFADVSARLLIPTEEISPRTLISQLDRSSVVRSRRTVCTL